MSIFFQSKDGVFVHQRRLLFFFVFTFFCFFLQLNKHRGKKIIKFAFFSRNDLKKGFGGGKGKGERRERGVKSSCRFVVRIQVYFLFLFYYWIKCCNSDSLLTIQNNTLRKKIMASDLGPFHVGVRKRGCSAYWCSRKGPY